MSFSTIDDIYARLITLDQELKVFYTRVTPIKLVIFGGSAVLIITDEQRTTRDIDAYFSSQLSQAEITLMNKYDINNNLQGGNEPYDFMTRIDPLNNQVFDCLEVYTAHPMDVIMHKLLNRGDSRDLEDIFILLDYVEDLELLKELYEDNLTDAIGNPTRFWDINDVYGQYWERNGLSSSS